MGAHSLSATARSAAPGTRGSRGTPTRCTVCRKPKDKVHRSRKTGKMVCAACSDRARMRTDACVDCGEKKLIQARGRCYACYKRAWRFARAEAAMKQSSRRRVRA